jgi:hypothetical protein
MTPGQPAQQLAAPVAMPGPPTHRGPRSAPPVGSSGRLRPHVAGSERHLAARLVAAATTPLTRAPAVAATPRLRADPIHACAANQHPAGRTATGAAPMGRRGVPRHARRHPVLPHPDHLQRDHLRRALRHPGRPRLGRRHLGRRHRLAMSAARIRLLSLFASGRLGAGMASARTKLLLTTGLNRACPMTQIHACSIRVSALSYVVSRS